MNFLRLALLAVFALVSSSGGVAEATVLTDNFNDGVVNANDWGRTFDYNPGHYLVETNGRLEFRADGSHRSSSLLTTNLALPLDQNFRAEVRFNSSSCVPSGCMYLSVHNAYTDIGTADEYLLIGNGNIASNQERSWSAGKVIDDVAISMVNPPTSVSSGSLYITNTNGTFQLGHVEHGVDTAVATYTVEDWTNCTEVFIGLGGWTDHHPMSGSGSYLDDFSLTLLDEPATAPQPRPETVYLAWGVPAPTAYTSVLGKKVRNPLASSTPPANVDPSYPIYIRNGLEEIFDAAGVDQITIINGAPANAEGKTIVYFAHEPAWAGEGKTFKGGSFGQDRFNRDSEGGTIVWLDETDTGESSAWREVELETVAHEIGHMLGLRHVNPLAGQGNPDEYDQEIMDYGLPNNRPPRFMPVASNCVSYGAEDWNSLWYSHNPVYHLRRWIDGESHDDLVAGNIIPGEWDLDIPMGAITTYLSINGQDRLIHNVRILGVDSSGDAIELDAFDQILLSELGDFCITLMPEYALSLVACSETDGPFDITLSLGDPSDFANTTIVPTSDAILAQLLQITEEGYQPLGDVIIESVPEPSMLCLLIAGGLVLACLALAKRKTLLKPEHT